MVTGNPAFLGCAPPIHNGHAPWQPCHLVPLPPFLGGAPGGIPGDSWPSAVSEALRVLAACLRDEGWRRCGACAGHDAHEVCDPPHWDALADRLEARAAAVMARGGAG